MLLSSREAVTPCCPCFVSFQLPAFPRDDPCDLLSVLLEFDVKGLVAKNRVLFSNKYDPLPLLLVSLSRNLTLQLIHSYSYFIPSLFLSLSHSFPLCLSLSISSSFASMALPFSAFLPPGLASRLSLAISCIISVYRGSGWK